MQIVMKVRETQFSWKNDFILSLLKNKLVAIHTQSSLQSVVGDPQDSWSAVSENHVRRLASDRAGQKSFRRQQPSAAAVGPTEQHLQPQRGCGRQERLRLRCFSLWTFPHQIHHVAGEVGLRGDCDFRVLVLCLLA